jgi:hypothetical protein
MPALAAQPRSVSPFEGKLLTITRALIGQAPLDSAQPILAERQPRPSALSRSAADLVGESLIRGCVLFLARSGGWRRERFLCDGKSREGRLWERSSPTDLALVFSRHALEWLIWLTAYRPDDLQAAPPLPDIELTPADRLLFFLTYDALRDGEFVTALRTRSVIGAHGLIRLAFPDDFSSATQEPSFAPWLGGLGASILEALEPWLVERWIAIEQRKRAIGDWSALAALGREQDRMLSAFTTAAESANRPDLVRFVLRIAAAVLPADVSKDMFSGGLQGNGPARLSDRIEVLRMAVAIPRHVLQLHNWERRCRAIGYLDEGYSVAQLWLAEWERLGGDALAERAESLVNEIKPLRVN